MQRGVTITVSISIALAAIILALIPFADAMHTVERLVAPSHSVNPPKQQSSALERSPSDLVSFRYT